MASGSGISIICNMHYHYAYISHSQSLFSLSLHFLPYLLPCPPLPLYTLSFPTTLPTILSLYSLTFLLPLFHSLFSHYTFPPYSPYPLLPFYSLLSHYTSHPPLLFLSHYTSTLYSSILFPSCPPNCYIFLSLCSFVYHLCHACTQSMHLCCNSVQCYMLTGLSSYLVFAVFVLFLCIVCPVGLHQSTSTWCPMVTARTVLAKRLINRH